MKKLLIITAFLMIGCASEDPLVVKQYTLRNQNERDPSGEPMVDHEKRRRLYGAVSMEERRARLGQYYTVIWQAEAGGKKELLFEYYQSGSGSQLKRQRSELPMDRASGKGEFSVIGDNYFSNGRVLAWKISLIENGRTIASEQSYLWE